MNCDAHLCWYGTCLVCVCMTVYEAERVAGKLPPMFFVFQDDNFSLSLLNELSVKYGIQTHLSHAPLPQKLEELREYIRREIKKELKVGFSFCFIDKTIDAGSR